MSAHSAHVDDFAARGLPPASAQPVFLFDRPELQYPERINCVTDFVDSHVAAGRGERLAILAPGGLAWTYADLADHVNRIANVLTGELGLVPGNRVLLRAPNNPMMVAAYLAVIKAGGIVVATMPLLRAKELGAIAAKAEIGLALCDDRLTAELGTAGALLAPLRRVVGFGELAERAAKASADFAAVDTSATDICLFGFTSGTTGTPKCTMHGHRDLLAICDAYGRNVLKAEPDDRFIGSPPLAFTFGLGGLVLFPFRVGASTVLIEKAPPAELLPAIAAYRPTVCFTAPTAYRAMIPMLKDHDWRSLKKCVSAGEALPKATFDAWKEATGLQLMDGIGATEMLHIFIAAPQELIRPGATGLPVPGYQAKVIGPDGEDLPAGTPGRLAVRGPTGCRYLSDERQARYVIDGWNVTGDTYLVDPEGYFWYQARSDDMIISAGYNIAGPEVEACLMSHPAVAECGVVGQPCPERGTVVKAYVVLKPGFAPGKTLAEELQAFVKAEIAPYKYPRSIAFVDQLPRTETGKLQRFALREIAARDAALTPGAS
ncbi:AMP-binding protein [Phreatobacter sp. AB_2022a]|uniref:AMP-binding protein n=1 Tax=Phreatobacter sp. AB_2022a TaxID=3003134 RepID=UPI0022875392|nr:AMP-binding protein [Phreatobacter sp. AB_2022a]MCZ0733664.1 AMP-binding protein [Phreatobacter sp. AB_2022a]